jgi:hypothetical protein
MARGISHREWRIYRDDHTDDLGRVDEQGFRAAIQAELAMCENLGERLGVAIVAAPIRTRLNGGGSWFTVGWVFKTATVPAAREGRGEPARSTTCRRSTRSPSRTRCPRSSSPP